MRDATKQPSAAVTDTTLGLWGGRQKRSQRLAMMTPSDMRFGAATTSALRRGGLETTMDIKSIWQNLSKGQQITAAGGVTALIASFLPWYVLKDQFIDNVSFRGTEFTFGWLGMVLLIGAAALTLAPAFGKDLGNDKIAGEQIAIAAAALGALLWTIRIVQVPALFFNTMGRGFGLFVAAAAAAAVTAGVVITMKEKGIAMPNADTIAALRSTSTPAPPQPAPAPQVAPYAAPAAHTPPAPTAPVHPAPVHQAPVQQAPAHQPPVPQAPVAPQAAPAPAPPHDGRF